MQFNSLDYMFFFPIVLVVYFVIPRKTRELWLLLASYYFYMSWNIKYAILIGTSTLVTYLGGLMIERIHSLRSKKWCLVGVVIVNLGILFAFKYANFAIDTLNRLIAIGGHNAINYRFSFLLPVGISFYTFQALGYIIDVYREDIKAEHNLVRYALFVSFFPQLVAGPIERSTNLMRQFEKLQDINVWNSRRIYSGFTYIVWGLFLKMVIADRVSLLVDTVFDGYRMYGSSELIVAALGFALQIYCDFYSYSTIAKGSALIIGIELMENFNVPYVARNIRDFWGRWHISLSSWFKDYLYIPLGGNRNGQLRKHINLLIVFFVSGLWHGASWNFVVWGGIHGVYHVLADILRKPRAYLISKMKINVECYSWRLLQELSTVVLVTFAWIFFRASSLSSALLYCKRIVTRFNPWVLFNGGLFEIGLNRPEMNILFVALLIMLLVEYVKEKKHQSLDSFLLSQNLWFRWTFLIGLVWMIFVFGEYGPQFDAKQFIYFQF